MARFRFQHVFIGLMLLATLGAFAIPQNSTRRATPEVQQLFAPASLPIRAIAKRLNGALSNEAAEQREKAQDFALEKDALTNDLAYTRAQLAAVQKQLEGLEKLGDLRTHCVPVRVVGGDPGTRESILLNGATPEGVRAGMYAIYPAGVVGLVERAGSAGGQVRLVTDRGFRIRAGFAGYRKDKKGRTQVMPIATPTVLVEGIGNNTLRIRNSLRLSDAQSAGLHEGDWVVVNDHDWPQILMGQRIAEVTKIGADPNTPLFAEVTLEPSTNLMRLEQVMVVVK